MNSVDPRPVRIPNGMHQSPRAPLGMAAMTAVMTPRNAMLTASRVNTGTRRAGSGGRGATTAYRVHAYERAMTDGA